MSWFTDPCLLLPRSTPRPTPAHAPLWLWPQLEHRALEEDNFPFKPCERHYINPLDPYPYAPLRQQQPSLPVDMVHTSALVAAAASLALGVTAEGLYAKNSAVLQVTGTDYDRVISRSNYTSVSARRQLRAVRANN